jgi:hypothetical protein
MGYRMPRPPKAFAEMMASVPTRAGAVFISNAKRPPGEPCGPQANLGGPSMLTLGSIKGFRGHFIIDRRNGSYFWGKRTSSSQG